jgi:hypothetical protein
MALREAWRQIWGISKIQICDFLTFASLPSGSSRTAAACWRFVSKAAHNENLQTYHRTQRPYKWPSAVPIFSWFSSVIILKTRFKRSINGLNLPFFCGEGRRSRCYGRTAAFRLIVRPCDEDEVMEHWWNEIDRGKPKYSGGGNLSQCHFVHHKSHGLTRDLGLRCERPATNLLSHGTATNLPLKCSVLSCVMTVSRFVQIATTRTPFALLATGPLSRLISTQNKPTSLTQSSNSS